MSQDKVADILSVIKNGQKSKLKSVFVGDSKFTKTILEVLKDEGYIKDFSSSSQNYKLKVDLAYVDSLPVIREVKRVSRPSRRVYSGAEDVPSNKGGLGVVVLSTSAGVMTSYEARKKSIGGEVLFKVY